MGRVGTQLERNFAWWIMNEMQRFGGAYVSILFICYFIQRNFNIHFFIICFKLKKKIKNIIITVPALDLH